MGVKRIGVTGWRGRLGSELVRRGCIPLKCDVTDLGWIEDVIRVHHPHAIVHCAAITDVDGCEERPDLAARVNAHGTYLLCRAFNGPIVYVSTDYIFDGQDGPYDEEARTNPLGWYGWSKLGGEIAVRARRYERDLIVRTTVLFDCYSENFVTTVARRLLNGDRFQLPGKLTGSPTYVPHLAEAILAAVQTQVKGTVNITGSRVMSRLDMGDYIARQVGIEGAITPGPITGPTNRPIKAGLTVNKAQALGLPIYDPLKGMKAACEHVATMAAG